MGCSGRIFKHAYWIVLRFGTNATRLWTYLYYIICESHLIASHRIALQMYASRTTCINNSTRWSPDSKKEQPYISSLKVLRPNAYNTCGFHRSNHHSDNLNKNGSHVQFAYQCSFVRALLVHVYFIREYFNMNSACFLALQSGSKCSKQVLF